MGSIDRNISLNLKRIRQNNKLSLDQVAAITGVSKSMISRIENGTSAPTVTTLWKLSNGLKVSFSTLIKENNQNQEITKKSDLLVPINDKSHRLYSIIPFDSHSKFELYEMEFVPNSKHISSAHINAVEEIIYVQNGELVLTINDNEITLKKGDLFKFIPDSVHIYSNQSKQGNNILVTIVYD